MTGFRWRHFCGEVILRAVHWYCRYGVSYRDLEEMLARLLAEHGPGLPMPELRRIIAGSCPRMIAGHAHDVCGVHFPGLIGLDLA